MSVTLIKDAIKTDAATDSSTSRSGTAAASANQVFVAVHTGAGNHSQANANRNKQLCKLACQQAMNLLRSNKSAMDAVTAAVATLENDDITNAGYGSNLTVQGDVECEACLMDGASLHFGSVGALSGVKNPVKVANFLVKEQIKGPLPFGRIRPSILVGKGAKAYCAEHHMDVNYEMTTKSSFNTYSRYKRKCGLVESGNNDTKRRKLESETLETNETTLTSKKSAETFDLSRPSKESVQDTVGAICVDQNGNIAAAASTGGLWLKHQGRLGPISMYGAGCWAQNHKSEDKPGVAVVTSGCGEQLMKTVLAKTCAEKIRSSDGLSETLFQSFKTDFMESEFLSSSPQKLGGVLALKLDLTAECREVELSWVHSTNSFCFAFMGGEQKSPKAIMSYLEDKCRPGHNFVIGGLT